MKLKNLEYIYITEIKTVYVPILIYNGSKSHALYLELVQANKQ